MSARKVPWFRVFIEGAVIVGSILLAFWIDAAWELRGEAEERRVLLTALKKDFEGYEELLAQRLEGTRRDSAAVDRILAATGPQRGDMTSAELETHLARIWNLSLSDMSRGATAGVLEDARRDLIQSPELLESLAVWQQSVVRLGRWDEYLVRAGERLSHYTYARWPNRGYGFFPHETRFPRNPEVLLSSVEFESLVYERGVAAVGLIEQLEGLMEQRTRIERLLIEELAGGPAGAR